MAKIAIEKFIDTNSHKYDFVSNSLNHQTSTSVSEIWIDYAIPELQKRNKLDAPMSSFIMVVSSEDETAARKLAKVYAELGHPLRVEVNANLSYLEHYMVMLMPK